jgi:hypothetical protein
MNAENVRTFIYHDSPIFLFIFDSPFGCLMVAISRKIRSLGIPDGSCLLSLGILFCFALETELASYDPSDL